MKLWMYRTARAAMMAFDEAYRRLGRGHVAKFCSREIWGPGGEITKYGWAKDRQEAERYAGVSYSEVLFGDYVPEDVKSYLIPLQRSLT